MTDTNWAPSRIWLQRGVGEEGSHTWCEDSIDDCEQAEYVRVDSAEPVEMALCSTEQVFLKPNQLYRFYVKEGCAECAHIADPTTAPPPASTNKLTDEQIVEMARNHSHLFDDGASIWTRDSLIEFARALLRTSSASAQEAEDEPLTCDFCGAQTDDPWHTSDATRKHLHQCDACHADSGQELTDEQIVQIGHQYFRPGHDPKAVTNFVKAVRACFRASDSAAVRDNEGQS